MHAHVLNVIISWVDNVDMQKQKQELSYKSGDLQLGKLAFL